MVNITAPPFAHRRTYESLSYSKTSEELIFRQRRHLIRSLDSWIYRSIPKGGSSKALRLFACCPSRAISLIEALSNIEG